MDCKADIIHAQAIVLGSPEDVVPAMAHVQTSRTRLRRKLGSVFKEYHAESLLNLPIHQA